MRGLDICCFYFTHFPEFSIQYSFSATKIRIAIDLDRFDPATPAPYPEFNYSPVKINGWFPPSPPSPRVPASTDQEGDDAVPHQPRRPGLRPQPPGGPRAPEVVQPVRRDGQEGRQDALQADGQGPVRHAPRCLTGRTPGSFCVSKKVDQSCKVFPSRFLINSKIPILLSDPHKTCPH